VLCTLIVAKNKMADLEFEELAAGNVMRSLEQIPQHFRAPAKCYTLAHDMDVDDDDVPVQMGKSCSKLALEEEPRRRNPAPFPADVTHILASRLDGKVAAGTDTTKREDAKRIPTLAEELLQMQEILPQCDNQPVNQPDHQNSNQFTPSNPFQVEEGEGEAYDIWPATNAEGDSGNSTETHSPQDIRTDKESESSASKNVPSEDVGGRRKATHRGLHKFTPRHPDEIDIDIGDPVFVQHEADDCWCEGVNLRTKCHGIFPSAYVVDVEYADFDAEDKKAKKERYLLDYLGSLETSVHKGEHVLCAAVKRLRQMSSVPHPQPCFLEISDLGLHVTDKCKRDQVNPRTPCHDYFFALKNVTFCGFHPSEYQYLGFITKHPYEERFACHVFQGNGSTRHVAEAIGRAFQRFCQKFIELAYPVHEFYME